MHTISSAFLHVIPFISNVAHQTTTQQDHRLTGQETNDGLLFSTKNIAAPVHRQLPSGQY